MTKNSFFLVPKTLLFLLAAGGSDSFEIAVKVVVFGFVAADVFGVVVADDDDVSDTVAVAVVLNLTLVRVVLP